MKKIFFFLFFAVLLTAAGFIAFSFFNVERDPEATPSEAVPKGEDEAEDKAEDKAVDEAREEAMPREQRAEDMNTASDPVTEDEPAKLTEAEVLAWLHADRSLWPRQLDLAAPVTFVIHEGGERIGESTAPEGASVRLQEIDLESGEVMVALGELSRRIPITQTDLPRRSLEARDIFLQRIQAAGKMSEQTTADSAGSDQSAEAPAEKSFSRAEAKSLRDALVEWLERELEMAKATSNSDSIERFNRALDQAKRKGPDDFRPQENDVVSHLPVISDNPYGQAFLRARRTSGYSFPVKKRDDRYFESVSAVGCRSSAYELNPAVWDLCSPQSSFYLSPDHLKSVLAHLEDLIFLQKGGNFVVGGRGDGNMNRFTWASLNDSYLMLVRTFPDLLPDPLRDYYEKAIWMGAKHEVKSFEPEIYDWEKLKKRWENQTRDADYRLPFWYPNIDATYALMVHLAGRILQEKEPYREDAENFLELAELRVRRLAQVADPPPPYESNSEIGVQFPHGGWTYMGFTNETINYHNVTLRRLVRYWQLSDSPAAKKALVNSAPYFPISIEPAGVGLDTAAPFWKTLGTHRVSSTYPEIIAGVTGCPWNKALAEKIAARNGHEANLMAASLYNPDLEPAKLSDNAIILDRNIVGPRGRFGRWSFLATGRDTRRDRGKMSYVGAMVTNEDPKAFPVSGALMGAFFEYKETPDDRKYISMGDRTGGTEISQTHLHEKGAAFTVETTLQEPNSGGGRNKAERLPWLQTQLWILTGQRMVGYMELRPESRQTGYGRAVIFRLGSERRGPHFANILKEQGKESWLVGDLALRVIEHNFDRAVIEKGDQRSYDFLWGSPGWGDIRLEDATDAGEQVYTPDDPRFVVVEIRPASSQPAGNITFSESRKGHYTLSVESGEGPMTLHYYDDTNEGRLSGAGSRQPLQ